MSIKRRRLLLLAASVPLVCQINAEPTTLTWDVICKRWITLFLAEEQIPGDAEVLIVFKYFVTQMKDKEFAKGFEAGLQATTQFEFPSSKKELKNVMQLENPVAKFLIAFFELSMESYYSSVAGFTNLGFDSPPQPFGYSIDMQNQR